MMSTEHNFEPDSRQYKWLENDLKKVDRKKTPWIIIGGHRAMYASQDEYGKLLLLFNKQSREQNSRLPTKFSRNASMVFVNDKY